MSARERSAEKFSTCINRMMSALNKHLQMFKSTEQTLLTTEMLSDVRNSLYNQGCELDTCVFEFNIHEDSYSWFQFHRYESENNRRQNEII